MKIIITRNPYRILGVLGNSKIKEVKKNISKIKAYTKIGKKIDLDYDFPFLVKNELNRDQKSISKAEGQILHNESKVKFALLWFVDLNPLDSVALKNLAKGETEKAIHIWSKATLNKSISKNNYSAYSNLSTLYLLLLFAKPLKELSPQEKGKNINDLISAIELKYQFISSVYFNDFNNLITKSDYTFSKIDAEIFYFEEIKKLINSSFSSSDILNVFNGLRADASKMFAESLIEEPILNIKKHISEAKEHISENATLGVTIGKMLIKKSLSEIKKLDKILAKTDHQYNTIVEKLANQIIQCGIALFNKTSDDQRYLSSYKYALSISVFEETKTRAKECIKHCEDERDATNCYCCNKDSKKKNKQTVRLYKVTNRSHFPSRVEFNYCDIDTYLCEDCSTQTTRVGKNTTTLLLTGFVAFLMSFIGLNTLLSSKETSLVISLVATAFVLLYVYKKFLSKYPTKTCNMYDHPSLVKYRKDGYTSSKPVA